MEITRELDRYNILRHFSLYEIREMVEAQVQSNDGICMGSEDEIDYFGSMYYEYCRIYRDDNIDYDMKNEIIDRFQQACLIILEAIGDKFNIQIDTESIASNIDELSGTTMILYDFFILNFHTHLKGFLMNYIVGNREKLNEVFAEYATKKDASSVTNRRYMMPEFVVICSNVSDIITWILSNALDTQTFLNYIDKEYALYDKLMYLFECGRVMGDISETIADLYTNSLHLSGFINFEIECELKSRFNAANN